MFPKLPLLLLSTITAARFGLCQNNSTAESFNDLVDNFPQCTRSCMHDLYEDLYADTCGDKKSSTNLKDIACICGDSPKDEEKYGEEVLAQCFLDSCPTIGTDDSDKYIDPVADLVKWCTPALQKYGTDSESSKFFILIGED